jgi:hypothetical protein
MLKGAGKPSNFLGILSLITMIIIWQMRLLNRKWIYTDIKINKKRRKGGLIHRY